MGAVKDLRYAARLLEEDGFVVAEFPDVGGAGQATQGKTWDEAREMAQDLIDSYITVCLKQDEDPMEPQETLPRGKRWEWVYPSQRVALAWQLRRLRRKAGMTQKQVANALGVAQETYVRWENPEKMNARVDTLERLARVYGGRLQVAIVDTPEAELVKAR